MEQTKAETNNKENRKDKKNNYMSKWGTFFKVISVIILVAFLSSMVLIIANQVRMSCAFNDISLAVAKGKNVAVSTEDADADEDDKSVNDKEVLSEIDYIEKLQKIQKEATASDITSLIYSIVITIVTALGMGLVTVIFKKAEEAKDAWKKATKNATAAIKAADDAKRAESASKEAAENAEKTKQRYEQAKENQSFFLEVLKILVIVSDARLALSLKKKAEATDRITEIERLTKNISEASDKQIITQLRDELLRLDSSVDDYKDYIEDSNISQVRKENDFVAVEFYKEKINNAVKHCDRLIAEAEKAERFKTE